MTETTANPTPVQSSWNEKKGKLKAQFNTLTDADLQYENGKKDEMLEKVGVKIGKTKEELASILSAF